MSKKPKEILKKVFGYDSFRESQEECIDAVLKKNDTLLLMPTGGGKSLCYQIPALIFDGLTVVVSPLISLMQDQVMQLQDLDVEAVLLNSSLTPQEYQENTEKILSGEARLLYVAPETLTKKATLEILSKVEVDCVAVDEAHCISEWGHDFRPDYRSLNVIRKNFPKAVYFAMTATATPRVREDILKNLELKKPKTFISSFNRTNLFYDVVEKTKPIDQVCGFLKERKGQSGIIYCFSRRQVEDLVFSLGLRDYKALPYHAGLNDKTRKENQKAFIQDDVPIIVATVAFGMGINKPNVRFVLHYDLPKNIESYYQETGRAGRDGIDSDCLLLYSSADTSKIRYIIEQKRSDTEKRAARTHLNAMVDFAESHECRRIPLLKYFGEKYSQKKCDKCDNCINPPKSEKELLDVVRLFLQAVSDTKDRATLRYVTDVLRGVKSERILRLEHNELDVYGAGKPLNIQEWQDVCSQLVSEILLLEDDKKGLLKVTPKGRKVLEGKVKAKGFSKAEADQKPKRKTMKVDVQNYDGKLFDLLRNKRKELADSHGIPPHVIFSDKSLVHMASNRPKYREDFAQIFGAVEKKVEKYGEDFMSVIRDYS